MSQFARRKGLVRSAIVDLLDDVEQRDQPVVKLLELQHQGVAGHIQNIALALAQKVKQGQNPPFVGGHARPEGGQALAGAAEIAGAPVLAHHGDGVELVAVLAQAAGHGQDVGPQLPEKDAQKHVQSPFAPLALAEADHAVDDHAQHQGVDGQKGHVRKNLVGVVGRAVGAVEQKIMGHVQKSGKRHQPGGDQQLFDPVEVWVRLFHRRFPCWLAVGDRLQST